MQDLTAHLRRDVGEVADGRVCFSHLDLGHHLPHVALARNNIVVDLVGVASAAAIWSASPTEGSPTSRKLSPVHSVNVGPRLVMLPLSERAR